jgi:hypothetical protein
MDPIYIQNNPLSPGRVVSAMTHMNPEAANETSVLLMSSQQYSANPHDLTMINEGSMRQPRHGK